MHNADTYTRLLPVLTLKDLKSLTAAIRSRLTRWRVRRIRVPALSDEWRAQHERDSAKH